MEARNPQITRHLQREDVQKRILQSMQYGRAEATVTISNAARLFGFTENQLRDWDEKGLLRPQRPTLEANQDGKSTKRRQYTPAELDKLAIIRELINEGFTPGTIPPDVDEIWSSIIGSKEQSVQGLKISRDEAEHLHIDQRVEHVDEEGFWRYFVSQALRLSIMLICENIPDTLAGLVLPLQKQNTIGIVRSPDDLSKLDDCLIGWLGRNRSFYTFLDFKPYFEFPTDFRVQPLVVIEEGIVKEEAPQDNTLIIVQRKTKPLNLSAPLVKTIRRLLKPIYNNINDWRSCFDYGMRDWVFQVTDFKSSSNPSDDVLNRLADVVVQLGGKTADDMDRWHFCCILLPKEPTLPLQQQSLVVRAQSRHAPYIISMATVSTKDPGLSLSAYQSGHVIYRPDTSVKDFMFANPEYEESTRSAIAIPVAGEDGMSLAVLYIASNETNAFSEDDQRVLRIVGKMVEELLMTYRARQQTMGKLSDLIVNPDIVDMSFKEFLSENDFVYDLDDLLTRLKAQLGEWEKPKQREEVSLDERKARYRAEASTGEVVSFIAVDIDKQSSLAERYGNQAARNLSREVGSRIQGQQRLSPNPEHRKAYHIHADRFYLILQGLTLEESRNKAKQLRTVLNGDYLVGARRISSERLMLPEGKLELSNVTVRLGVAAYPYEKLKEMLQRYSSDTAVAEVRAEIMRNIDELLNLGQQEGGNVITSWDIDSWGYIRWYPNPMTQSG